MRYLSLMVLVAIGLLSSLGAVAGTVEQDDDVKSAIDKVRDFIEGQKAALNIHGLAYVIIHGEKILADRNFGYADLQSQEPIVSSTLYRVGSITKVFTASMLMQLQERGMLQLDDPVQKHVPEFTVASDFLVQSQLHLDNWYRIPLVCRMKPHWTIGGPCSFQTRKSYSAALMASS